MRRLLLPLLLLLAACASDDSSGDGLADPTMGEPLHAEQQKGAAGAAGVRRPDERSDSRVLAHVDGDVITYRDVLLLAGPELRVLGEGEQRAAVEQNALLRILRDRIVYHAAVEAGVEMERDVLDSERAKRVKEIERNGGTLAAYLAERGMTRREFDDEIRRDWISTRYLRGALGLAGGDPHVRPIADVFVSPGEARAYWEQRPEQFTQPAHAGLRILVLAADTSAEDREAAVRAARVRVERARSRLLAGEDWVPIYREVMGTVDPDDADGYVEIGRGEKADWIEAFAFGGARGAVSDVIQKGSLFFLMQSDGHQEERVVPLEEIFDKVRDTLGTAKRGRATYEVELDLLERASVRPPERAAELRNLLSTGHRQIMDRLGL